MFSPPSSRNLAQFDSLLSDLRVAEIEDRLRRELKLDDSIHFASYEQPPTQAVRKGIEVTMPAQAVFRVVSPNPHPRHKGRLLDSFAVAELSDWREMEDTAWRFAGMGDPAYPIFRALCLREHLPARKNFEEMV